MTTQRIGILTGGGDCPGLNPSIKAIVKKALHSGLTPIGLLDGWRGLTDENLSPITLFLDDVRHIDRQGGTMLGTSRTNPFKSPDGAQKVMHRMTELGLDRLIAIGGEDTLGVASKLHEQFGLDVVGIPKTIDGDLVGTDYSLGFESALQVITNCVDNLRSTAQSHSRVFVVEVMGRHSGHLALKGGISAGASVTLIPECPFDIQRVADLLTARKNRGCRYSIVLVAEGAMPKGETITVQSGSKDAFGHARLGGIAQNLADEIEQRCHLETRAVNLSHLQRGGQPVSYDRRMGFYFGTAAVEALLSGQFGNMVALRDGRIKLSLLAMVKNINVVDIENSYDTSIYQAKREIFNLTGGL